MTRLNNLCIAGRLSRDPELKHTTKGTPVASFGIACDSPIKNEDGEYGTDWFNVTAWSKTAEFIMEHFQKGKEILLVGRLSYRTWVDESTGLNRSTVFITAQDVTFVGSKSQGGGGYTPSDDEAPPRSNREPTAAKEKERPARPETRQNSSAPPKAATARPTRPAATTEDDDEADPFANEANYSGHNK